LKHVPGKSIGKADGLSRRLDWQEGVEKNNEDWMLIKPEWVRGAETIVEEGNLRERIKTAQKGDERVVKAVEELKKAGVKTLRDEEWEIEDSVVLKKGRIYVPEGELRGEIIRLHHNTCKEAKLQAGIKPTALCSAIDKENSIESLLDSATLYIQLLLWLCILPSTVLMLVS